jgi:predicted phosphodiesterase
MGNSDGFMLDPDYGSERTTERHIAQREWALEQIGPERLEYVRSFRPTVELDLDGTRLLCFHATPRSNEEVVLPTDPVDPFAGTDADLLAGGHVHIQQVPRVGEALYVNPGSVGCGYGSVVPEGFSLDPWASYAIVEPGSVELRRVPFDLDELASVTYASGIPMPDFTLSLYRR